MVSLSQELKRWAVEELELPAARLPDDGYIKTLCVGPGASIWKYITQHVHKERYKVLQDKELNQMKNQNKDARRLELQREIDALQTELNQLDTKISRVEDQLATEEQNVNRSWEDFTESRHRQILLDSFRQRCAEERNVLLQDTHMIGTQRHALEELSKFTHEQRKAVIQHWTSAVEVDEDTRFIRKHVCLCVCIPGFFFFLSCTSTPYYNLSMFNFQNFLHAHPPNQVLSALQALTSRQQVVLEEKIAALNVERDISDLGFRYESDHLIDVSPGQEEDLTPVRSLLQSAWEEVEQSYFELAQTRNRCGQLETELTALMSKAERAHGSDPVSRCVFELEMEGVKQTAVRDSIREQCAQLQMQAREGQDAIRTVQTQWQSVMDFRQLVLNPQFGSVIKASSGLRNSVSQGAKHFSCVALAALDRRVMKGRGQKLPAAQLSIHRIQSPAFHKLCESLSFPMYMAPQELWSQAAALRLELRNLHRLLQLFSESSADVQKLTAQLPSPDQQTLVQRVKMVDEEILQTLLPRARELTQRCSKGLLYTEQVKTAILHW
ncbi:HAUS augmin-like complex subunit 5 [Labeo rohita]|uniref:HAUS augmin-like complex subunit 5 n=1 Tax=Labeo rohita TaxID=84645 RepID=A0ABQ8MFT2_LABRO|nr:HAUS augmin-like complex subunit 5 [Labeo rohita]